MEKSFEMLYSLFRARYCRRIIQSQQSGMKGITPTESYCAEVICLMDGPTITEFSRFLGISPSNAHYKIARLEQKGYIIKEPSQQDKREYRLLPTPDCERNFGMGNRDNARLMQTIKERLSLPEQIDLKKTMEKIILLMQEAEEDLNDKDTDRYSQ